MDLPTMVSLRPGDAVKALVRHLRRAGPWRTTKLILRNLAVNFADWQEQRFDRRHNVQTAHDVALDELEFESEHKAFAEDYVPTPISALKRAIESIPDDLNDVVFIDVGSGKGRMLFYASNYPFKRIVGIEFSAHLHALCEENLSRFRNPKQKFNNIESVCADVIDYDFPDENLFIFMFNPFSQMVMERLVARLEAHHRASGKKIYIAYYNPKHGDLLQNANFLEERGCRQPVQYLSVYAIWPTAMFVTRPVQAGTLVPARQAAEEPDTVVRAERATEPLPQSQPTARNSGEAEAAAPGSTD